MRFFGLVFALLAALALAQTQTNYINVPNGGFDVKAGQPFTITWSNPSSGDVTIRLTQGNVVTPGAGIELTTVPASAKIATFNIPTNVNNGQYNFEIVDNTNPANINFSSAFVISGATAVASTTGSTTTSASTTTSSSSASSSSSSSHSSSTSSSASTTSASTSRSSSSTSTSASASATTKVSSSNGVANAQAGGMLALLAGAIAVF